MDYKTSEGDIRLESPKYPIYTKEQVLSESSLSWV